MPATPSSNYARNGLRAIVLGTALLAGAAETASARNGRNAALIGGAAAGVLGGVALGAMLGAQPVPPPPPAYRARPIYVEEEEIVLRPRRSPVCHYERRKVWLDEDAFTYRRVEVCE